MTPEQWARVKEHFHAALAQEESRRPSFVADVCAGDALVRAEVERLLEADRHAGNFIEHPAADTLLSGRVIGHYEIGHLLGAGGMGRVYAARDLELGREVAVKIAVLESDDAQMRLRREAQHASRLSHPHICHIYEVGRAEGRVFVVMELVSGRPVADLVREGPLPAATARQYASEIADALAHAHEQGVTHRDLKSTNVMITPKRGAKVLDFGLARRLETHQLDALSQSEGSLTADGLLAGTLSYMPPELLRGQRGDQRADIWALGVLLHEMVTGERPFTGATGFELSAAILHQPPAPLPADVPAAMGDIIQRCLEKNPDNRYQHATDLHRALVDMDATPRRRPTPKRTSRWLIGTGLVLLLTGLIVAAGLWKGVRSGAFSVIHGYSLLSTGQFDDAIDEFEAVTEDQPDDANAWDSLGEGYLAQGRPDKALEAYGKALALDARYAPSQRGRAVALAALGRYDEALVDPPPDVLIQAWTLSRVGRYRDADDILRVAAEDADHEDAAAARLTIAWLLIEQQQYARALSEIAQAESTLKLPADETRHPTLALAEYLAVVASLRAGSLDDAVSHDAALKKRADATERIEANWVAAAEGEMALARQDYVRAISSFDAARSAAWLTLGRNSLAMFAINPPSRDGRARIEVERGNRVAAVEEYRRLTRSKPASASMLEPRHVLELARLLEAQGNSAAARTEYERFLRLWANADPDLPEVMETRAAVARLSA